MPFLKNLGMAEVIIIVLVLIVFLGSKKMSELAKSAGESTKELKKVQKEYQNAMEEVKKPIVKEGKEVES